MGRRQAVTVLMIPAFAKIAVDLAFYTQPSSGFIACYNPAVSGNAKKPKEDDNVIPKKPFKRLSLDGNIDRPIPEDVYPVLDTDLARDNLENDISAADLQDL